jgi:hypothetical protein
MELISSARVTNKEHIPVRQRCTTSGTEHALPSRRWNGEQFT